MTLKFYVYSPSDNFWTCVEDIPVKIAHRVGYNDYSFYHTFYLEHDAWLSFADTACYFELTESDERLKNLPDGFIVGTFVFENLQQTPLGICNLKVREGKLVASACNIGATAQFDPGPTRIEGQFRI